MTITEYERSQLFSWFEEHMGKERANSLMSLLPPVGWADVATDRDLDVLGERLDNKIDRLGERLDTKIDRVADRLDAVDQRFEALATKAELYELRSDLQRTFVTWMFASQTAVIAAMGIFLALLR